MNSRAAASIVACGFLNLLPDNIRNLPYSNFTSLLSGSSFAPSPKSAKLSMFINYFQHYASENPPKDREICFVRKVLQDNMGEASWTSSPKLIQPVKLFTEAKIEDSKGSLHADFANRYIGGGVLDFGCVQEEIMFSRAPELCAAMPLFFAMDHREAIYISGAKYFSDYAGYAQHLKYAGDHETNRRSKGITEEDEPLSIIAIDATPYGAPGNPRQYEPDELLRELNKAYIGFLAGEEETKEFKTLRPIATGNWGCGAFGGKIQLKALLQLMAVSQAGRVMEYYSFGEKVAEGLESLVESLREKKRTVGWLASTVLLHDQKAGNDEKLLKDTRDLFEFVAQKNKQD